MGRIPRDVAKHYGISEVEYIKYLQSHEYRDRVFGSSKESIILIVVRSKNSSEIGMATISKAGHDFR